MFDRKPYPIVDNSKYFSKLSGSSKAVEQSAFKPKSLEDGLAMALKQRQDTITNCSYCNSIHIDYQGLGVYHCLECKKITKTKYAIVREYLESKGACTMIELIGATGLSKTDIDSLIRCGSVEYKNGKIGIGI